MRTIILGAALLVCGGSAAPSSPTEPEFSSERFRAHVTFLADDLLEGREGGTRGHELAARYIASQFAVLGLKPAGPDGYFLNVDLLEASASGGAREVTFTAPSGTRTLRHGAEAMVQGPIAGGEANVKGPVVFVGYGMKDVTVGYDDYKGLDVRGKIVLALWGTPEGVDSEIGAHLRSEQARTAAEHGASAILYLPTRATTAAFPWEKIVAMPDNAPTTWVRTDGTPFDARHGLRASALIDPKAAPALFEGTPRTFAQILEEAAAANGRPAGFPLAVTAQVRAATKVRRFSSPNVVGLIEGSAPDLKNEYVVLMGHADHIGQKNAPGGDRINNGALDNAAGIATLIEVARAFTEAAERPRRSILIVAVTGEEKGLLGAEYFARHPPVPIDRITAAINLDMPMLLYDFTDVVAFGATHSTVERAIQDAGRSMNIALAPDPWPEQAIFVRSDHYPMVKAGVPAVMLATGMANGGDAAWGKFLASHYHQPSDDVSLPIVWRAGAKFAELNYRAVRTLANDNERARWYANDYFGNLYAPTAPKVSRSERK